MGKGKRNKQIRRWVYQMTCGDLALLPRAHRKLILRRLFRKGKKDPHFLSRLVYS